MTAKEKRTFQLQQTALFMVFALIAALAVVPALLAAPAAANPLIPQAAPAQVKQLASGSDFAAAVPAVAESNNAPLAAASVSTAPTYHAGQPISSQPDTAQLALGAFLLVIGCGLVGRYAIRGYGYRP